MPTIGGDGDGKCCNFPFVQHGITYTKSCAPEYGSDKRWCPVAGDKLGYCVDSKQFNLSQVFFHNKLVYEKQGQARKIKANYFEFNSKISKIRKLLRKF